MPTPEDWVRAYLDVRVPTLQIDGGSRILSGPTVSVPITEYANASESQYQGPRDRANSRLQNWVKGPGRQRGLIVEHDHVRLLVADPIQTTLGTIHRVFLGKGSPDDIREVLRLSSLWFSAVPDAVLDCGAVDLRTFGQRLIGVDCNGFVGTYLHNGHPETGFGSQFYIPGVPGHAHARSALQGAPGDRHVIQSLDLIISHGWGHVAIIGQIHSRSDQEIVCNVCQSRSTSLHGVHCGVARIRRRHDLFFMPDEPLTGIYGLRQLQPNG